MKRLLVKSGVLAGLMLMFGVAGNAQISQQYRAEIPFDFQVNNKSYSAGDYTVGPVSANSSVGSVAFLDRKSGKMQLIGQTQLGGDGRIDASKLVFVKANGRYTLSRIITRTFEMKMKTAHTDVRLAKNAKPETVAVGLK